MEDGIKSIKAFMERKRVRLGKSPASVVLYGIGERDAEGMKKVMDHVQFRRFNSMKSLKFTLTTSNDLAKLTNKSLLFAPMSVEHVEVETLSPSDQSPDWNCECILDQSSDIESLKLEVHTNIIFEGGGIYTSLLRLSLYNSPAPSLLHHLGKFPRLQDLRIDGTDLYEMEMPSESIVMPQLQGLHIFSVTNFPWGKISTPCLRRLSDNNGSGDHSALEFCFRHSSITELNYPTWIEEDQLKLIAKSVVNLEYLDTGGDLRGMYLEGIADMPFPPLPKLETLTVDDTGEHRLSLLEFESFVYRRLLPQHPQDMPTLKVWNIVVISSEVDLLPWRKSDLMSRLHETREECEFDEEMHYVVLKIK